MPLQAVADALQFELGSAGLNLIATHTAFFVGQLPYGPSTACSDSSFESTAFFTTFFFVPFAEGFFFSPFAEGFFFSFFLGPSVLICKANSSPSSTPSSSPSSTTSS